MADKVCACGNPATTNGRCSNCRAIYQREWYQKNKSAQKARAKIHNKRMREKYRKLADELKSNPCADCGGSFHPVVMDFDHIGDDKIVNVAKMAQGYGMDAILREIAKCELVCANCHRMRTHRRRLIAQADRAVLS